MYALTATRAYTAAPLVIASATASTNATTAGSAIDASTDSAWGSGSATNPSLTLSLAAPMQLATLAIKANPVGTYAVDVSSDNATWTPALANQKNTTWGVESKALPDGTTGKYVRLRFQNGGTQVMVFQVGLSGAAIAAAPATTAPASSAPAAGGVVSSITGLLASASATTASFPASAAVDGNSNTQWSSNGTANAWIQVDRGTTGALTSVGVKLAPGPTFAVQVSKDGVTWTQALANQATTTWNSETKALPAGTTGRYVRLQFPGTAKAQVFELTVAGSTAAPTPAPTIAPTAAPVATPTPFPTVAPTAVAIIVTPGNVLHAADSHILGTCRNHVAGQFANGAAKVAALKSLQPTWGARKYLYRVGHGISDGRTDYSYMLGFHFEQVWNTTTSYPYDDIRGALNEADTLGADQMHVVNFGTSDAAEAGRYVSYLNHAGDANRVKYPVAQQNVKMFELGNEISWNLERGHDQYAATETAYAQRAKGFAQAMRANSDVPIKIGAVAGTNSNWMGTGWSGGATTVKNILTTMGSDVDFLIYHGYPSWPMNVPGNLDTYMAQNEWNKQKLESEIKPAIKANAGGRDVYIANTEFFSNLYNDVPHARGMFGAMYSADSILLAFNEDIRTCVQFCFDHGDMADSSFFIGNDPTNTTPMFKLQQLVAQHWGDNIVATAGQNIPSKTVTGASATIAMPKLSFSAATSGNKTYVMVLNRTNDSDVASEVNVGFKPSAVTAYTLGGTTGWDSTTASVTTTTNPSLAGMTFKRATVTILEITK